MKLSDYGVSKRLNSLSKKFCKTNAETIIYMAPEILMGKENNFKCDLWNIRIIIYKLKFWKSPFSGMTETALIENIKNFRNETLKSTGDKDLDDLIKNLLQKEPSKRFDWDQYFNHPFFLDTKDEIKLVYKSEINSIQNIFGKKFVENNKNNIELIINGEKSELIEKYKLKKGLNDIKMIIKNKIKNLENMFYECNNLTNIDQLKFLDINEDNNFSEMFTGCQSLNDIKALRKWKVSKVSNFSYMFSGCSLLKDIKGLQNWNVSNGKNFSYMFS